MSKRPTPEEEDRLRTALDETFEIGSAGTLPAERIVCTNVVAGAGRTVPPASRALATAVAFFDECYGREEGAS